MYVRTNPPGKLGRSRQNMRGILAARFNALGYSYGDSGGGIDWGSILQTGIQTAGSVAKVAVTPPMYSSVVNPLTGQSSVTSYAGSPGLFPSTSAALGSSLGTASLTSLIMSPIGIIGVVILVIALAKR